MEWYSFNDGNSIDTEGSEGGLIQQDEEHPLGARITLEQNAGIAPFAITCAIYGWMFHTRFFNSQTVAEAEYEQMKHALAEILKLIPLNSDPGADQKMVEVSEQISEFADKYS